MSSPVIDIAEQFDFKLVSMDEAKPDQRGILAVLRGVTFVPGGRSRNGRLYEDGFWEHVLEDEDLKRLLSERRLFGTIGHVEKETDDLLREGAASHITSRLWIDDNGDGMGEHLILDTPSGRFLETYIRAGAQLRTSTKGLGMLLSRKSPLGDDIPDKGNFVLKRVDFVSEPGFLEARPALVEALSKEQRDSAIKAGLLMTPGGNRRMGSNISEDANATAIERLSSSNAKFQVDFTESQRRNEVLASEKAALEESNRTLRARVAELEGREKALTESLGTPSKIRSTLEGVESVLEGYSEFGSPQDLSERFQQIEEFFGSVGTPEQIVATLTDIEEFFSRVGTADKIEELLGLFESFMSEHGTPEQVAQALHLSESCIGTLVSRHHAGQALKLAEEFGAPKQTVARLMQSFRGDLSSVRKTLEELRESKSLSRYQGGPDTVSEARPGMKNGLPTGDAIMESGRIDRLFKAAGGGPVTG